MATITKIQVRQGTDAQRRTANSTGIIFSTGEPAFCIDTKRAFIGDGTTPGGNPVGIQNIGSVPVLFGNYQNGLTLNAVNLFTSKGASIGDIIYDADTRGIYSLSSVSTFPPLSSDLVKYDLSTLVNSTQLEYNSLRQLQIKTGGVGALQLSPNIVDEATLTKVYGGPMSIRLNSVSNDYLFQMNPNTVKVNNTGVAGAPVDLAVGVNQFVGRTSTSGLTAVPFNALFANASFTGDNGVSVSTTLTSTVISLNSDLLSANDLKITLKRNTDILGATSIFGNVLVTGTFNATGNISSNSDIIAFSTSDLSLKENIIQLSNPLEKINKLNGYSFTWKKAQNYEYLQGPDVGLMAQEVEEVIPEAVITRKDGVKAVNYNKIIPLLVECIHTLKNQIKELKNEIRKSS